MTDQTADFMVPQSQDLGRLKLSAVDRETLRALADEVARRHGTNSSEYPGSAKGRSNL